MDDLILSGFCPVDIYNSLHKQTGGPFKFIRLETSNRAIYNYFNTSEGLEVSEGLVLSAIFGGQVEQAKLAGELLKESWLFNATRQKWMPFTGKNFSIKDGAETGIFIAIHKVLQKAFREVEHTLEGADQRKKFDKELKALSSRAHLTAIAGLLEAHLYTDEHGLDADPLVLNCKNGELNLATGELSKHKASSRLSKIAAVSYSTEAQAPVRFLEFINFIAPEPDVQQFLQTWCGLTLSGLDDWQAFVYAYGDGSNGKSTISQVMLKLLGDYSMTVDVDVIVGGKRQNSSDDYKVADMKGKRLVVGTEIAKGYPMNESRVKGLTGGDVITARPIRGNPIQFTNTAKYFFFGNHKLVIRGQDEGIWRRIYMLPFEAKFTEITAKSMSVVMSEFEQEFSGILNWALEGLHRYLDSGRKLPKPEKIAAATKEYRRDSDVLADFMEEELERHDAPAANIPVKELLIKYSEFCDQRKENRSYSSSRAFKSALIERGYEVKVAGNSRANALIGYRFATAEGLPIVEEDAPF